MSLRADGLAAGFPQQRVLGDLTLDIAPGQCWAVLGNNGSGKTTLLHTLAGIRAPLAGSVALDDIKLDAIGTMERSRKIALLLQEEPLEFWGSVMEYVSLGRYPHRRGWFAAAPEDEAIARAQLELLELDRFSERPLASLSGGERQRARLALALTQQPIYYLLDEPLQHLDLRHQARVLSHFARLAAAGEAAVVMSLHDPVLAQRCCDCALLLFEQAAPLGGAAQTVLTPDNLERLYGVPVTL
jgi:iron complex transport system ATP-binding protein